MAIHGGGGGGGGCAPPPCPTTQTRNKKQTQKVLEEGRRDGEPADLLATALLVEQEAVLKDRHSASAVAPVCIAVMTAGGGVCVRSRISPLKNKHKLTICVLNHQHAH